jgi:hypothetical protein
MGEIRVEVFDCAVENKWQIGYDPTAYRTTFCGEAVSVKEGKHTRIFGRHMVCQRM